MEIKTKFANTAKFHLLHGATCFDRFRSSSYSQILFHVNLNMMSKGRSMLFCELCCVPTDLVSIYDMKTQQNYILKNSSLLHTMKACRASRILTRFIFNLGAPDGR